MSLSIFSKDLPIHCGRIQTLSPQGGMTAYGASRPLRRIPVIVSFLNPQPALSFVGGNRSSCPKAVIDVKR